MKSRRLGYELKMLSENLNPLERFLRALVYWMAHTKVQYDSSGLVWDIEGHRFRCDFINELYVDPISGLLTTGSFKLLR